MNRYFLGLLWVIVVPTLTCAEEPPKTSAAWELMLLDAAPPGMGETDSTAVGDIDGDGKQEVVIGGVGALLWYRPATFEKGLVARGHFHVGLALADIDGDGAKEIIAGRNKDGKWAISWFKPGKDLDHPGVEHVIDPDPAGGPHDLIFAELDGDGKPELIANAMYCSTPGLYTYKPGADLTRPWKKQLIQTGFHLEGTAAGDLEGKGHMDLVCGPYWFSPPAAGPFSGQPWQRHRFAPHFRDWCRAAVIDVNGDGRKDIVLVEDEYPDGHLSWFENRVGLDAEHPWVEHPIESRLNFAHSLQAWRDPKSGAVQVLMGEMNQGGWGAPYNFEARLLKFVFTNQGRSVHRELLYQGEGTHEARIADLYGDGMVEIVGHSGQVVNTRYPDCIGSVQIFKQRPGKPLFQNYRHEFIDRDKPATGTDIVWVDVDGDGLPDVVCGSWWYKNPRWERHPIPGVAQVLNAYDIDKDGRKELIAIKGRPGARDFYSALSSELCWLKPVDPLHGRWEEHRIGTGSGDWPHGTLVGPLLPGGKLALVTGYHDPQGKMSHPYYPEIWEIPSDPRQGPWKKRVLAEIPYGEEMALGDFNGDGRPDIAAGRWWLENLGDGTFKPHQIIQNFPAARLAVVDVNGDGKPDIVEGEEVLDFKNRLVPYARLVWFENPGTAGGAWKMHVIDRVHCPHSLSVADLDGDGKPEVVAAEHDPFKPYQGRCRLFVYKLADPKGTAWSRYVLDDHFEQHDGAKVVELAPGKFGILGQGWAESKFVHLWRPD